VVEWEEDGIGAIPFSGCSGYILMVNLHLRI